MASCKKSWTATEESRLKLQFLSFTSSILKKGKNILLNTSKMEVYQGAIIRRIKIKQKEIDQDIVIKMFEKLKGKVHMANENGLTSLLKI